MIMSSLKIWKEKSTTVSSLLPAIRNRAVDHHQAQRLLVSSSYWQGCARKEFVAQQRKNLARSVFQQHSASDIGELVYKHSRRYHYLATYFGISVVMTVCLIHSCLLLTGYWPTAAEYDDPTKHMFLGVGLAFGTVLYLLSHALVSRTIMYIYYNEMTHRFLAVCYNWRMARKNLVFKPGDVQLVENYTSMIQLLRGGYVIDKQSYHISSCDFRSTRHYNLMLGSVNP